MEVHQLVQFVQVQEVHQHQKVLHVHSEEQAWEGRSRCCGAGPVMQRFMGGSRRYAKAAIGPGSQWLANPIYTPPEQPPPVDNICEMECPLRTVAKHLSRVSGRAFDRCRSSSTVGSPSSSSVDGSVRVTGAQGLVWSSNPVFADEQGVPWGPGAAGGRDSGSSRQSRISSRISRTSRISSAYDVELSPLPRIRTNHERELTEDSAKELATGALSGVSPVVSGFISGRDSRDFDAVNTYTAEWLRPEELRSAALRYSPRPADRRGGIHAGPGRDSCMDDFIHRLEENSWSKIGKLRSDIEDKQGEIASLIDAVSDGTSQRRKIVSYPLPDALKQIHELREMIQDMDKVIANLYQDIAREIAALAKMGNAMATPRASVPWHVSGAQAMMPWSMSGSSSVRKQRSPARRRRSLRGPSRQDSLEGDTLSRLEVQVQVLAEQLQVLQTKVRDQKLRRSAGHRAEHPAGRNRSACAAAPLDGPQDAAQRRAAPQEVARCTQAPQEEPQRPAAPRDKAEHPAAAPRCEEDTAESGDRTERSAESAQQARTTDRSATPSCDEFHSAHRSSDGGRSTHRSCDDGHSTHRSAGSSACVSAVSELASVVEKGSDASDISGTYEIVLNPFFEDGDNPLFGAGDDVPGCPPPFFDGCWRQSSFWPVEAQYDSIAVMQQLVAESDAEIARLTAEIGGGGYYTPAYYPVQAAGVNGYMRRNPVFDGRSPHQGVLAV
ncbi:unnamed protein product [Ostreobium quekettii]|uniref:Uncharacterized protein n=1 Tax=Ostreobium quekettii TaxID=121088 RepID=A0A8S1IWC5_9CHLO|nr:unnamed protein product [Ostreobium quekettii]